MTEQAAPDTELFEMNNSLSALASSFNLQSVVGIGAGTQVSQTTTLMINLRYNLITQNPVLLSQSYVEHGLIQTLIDQPVEDAFSPGFEIKSSQLSPDELDELNVSLEEHGDIRAVMQTTKWARLFGGAVIMIITGQKPDTPFNVEQIREGSPLEFRPVELWELIDEGALAVGGTAPNESYGEITSEYFMYYGKRVHRSRLLFIKGKEAPARLRAVLRGWGMSEVERLVRSLNQYMKNGNVVFDLLDEAKVDIYKMKGFNTALATIMGTENVSKRLQHANTIKNYQNALTMDVDDEYEQKQIAFSGLSEVLVQIRQGIASDMKFPMTKLFGTSPGGLNATGESDLENYNSMVESEVRAKIKFIMARVIGIRCQWLFGYVPDDIKIKFNSLRLMTPEEEEKVKDYQFKRIDQAYKGGLISAQEAKQGINKSALMPIEIDETSDALPMPGTETDEKTEKQTPEKKEKAKK